MTMMMMTMKITSITIASITIINFRSITYSLFNADKKENSLYDAVYKSMHTCARARVHVQIRVKIFMGVSKKYYNK